MPSAEPADGPGAMAPSSPSHPGRPQPPARDSTWTQCCAGAVDTLPILTGIVPFALVLGAQASRVGLTPAEVPLLTGLNFAGGAEFAALSLWTLPPHVLAIVAVTLLVNSRMLVMGAALAPFLRHQPKRKVLPSLFLMTDASWALSMAHARRRAQAGAAHPFSLPYYLGSSLLLYVAWIGFTATGALLGPVLGPAHDYGLDMAFPAVFLVMLRGLWRGWRHARPWLAGLAAAALTYWHMGGGAWHVVAGALAGMATAFLLAPRPGKAGR